MPILFTSDRLDFIKLTESEFDYFCEMDLDPQVMEFYTSRPHGTIADARASFKRYTDYQKKFPQLGGFMAFEKGTKKFIGLGVLIHIELNPDHNKYEVGYRLPVRNWNKGFATEICKTLLSYGFGTLGFEEIYGTTNPQNKISQKVLLKCDFKEIGTTDSYGGSTLFILKKK